MCVKFAIRTVPTCAQQWDVYRTYTLQYDRGAGKDRPRKDVGTIRISVRLAHPGQEEGNQNAEVVPCIIFRAHHCIIYITANLFGGCFEKL